MERQYAYLACAVGALALGASAQAASYHWNFPLDGLQEVLPVATPATGTGDVWYDDVTNEISWNVSYQDLIGAITAAHFHGPAPVGVNAGVQLGVTVGPSPLTGGPSVITEAQEVDLLAGNWYFNIHSTFKTGGEIRGQVVPEPASLGLLAMGGLAMLRRRRRAL